MHLSILREYDVKPLLYMVYTTLMNFSTKWLVMRKVYTDVGGII